jgi:hypothetical protein
MPSNKAEGSQVATVTTEHSLATVTDAGNYLLLVDTNVLALGDELILRVKLKVRSTGTTRLAFQATYKNVVGEPIIQSIPVSVVEEAVFTLEQATGTSRTFDWAVVDMS